MLIDVETAADEPRPRPRRRLVAQSGHQLGRRSRRNCESHIFFFFFYRVLLGFSHGYTGSFLVLPSFTGFHGSTLFFFVKILLWCYPFFFNLLLRGVYLVLPGFAAKFLSRGSSFQVLPSFYRVSRCCTDHGSTLFFLSRYCFGVNRFF